MLHKFYIWTILRVISGRESFTWRCCLYDDDIEHIFVTHDLFSRQLIRASLHFSLTVWDDKRHVLGGGKIISHIHLLKGEVLCSEAEVGVGCDRILSQISVNSREWIKTYIERHVVELQQQSLIKVYSNHYFSPKWYSEWRLLCLSLSLHTSVPHQSSTS